MRLEMKAMSSQSFSLSRIKSLLHHIEFNYLESKHLPVDQFICSPPFSVGGYEWSLLFYPHGHSDNENKGNHVSLYLTLMSETKEVHAEHFFYVVDNRGKYIPLYAPAVDTFSSPSDNCSTWGYQKFTSRDKLEARYCKDGMFVIACGISVVSAPAGIDDCSNDMYDDIEKLWERGERFDVTFEVEEERIPAHRFMLAAQSPVFEAELYGPMAEAKSSCIKIKDMKAEVFNALLRFVYTDCCEPFEKVLSIELVQDLFIAADRYALEKLKVQCQQRLWVTLSVDTVLSTLIIAEQHSSAWLKEKCLEFASKPENFTELALTEEYAQMVQSFPSLLIELR
ncbi:hypothetical protein LUZ61_015040 [Rhynchospora tenuis]|uniref:BTB domain-containing protein n=1 Tax=Rhynchospora tenuis TaxID=198213 RepID=A0AAD5WC27_9POAL|nr:hypothetical protein LUZ61_015040 [Rhynchospora tenuis]